MKNDAILERLISEEWPKLKRRAENETDVEKLIAAIREIDEFLLHLEQRVIASDENRLSANAVSEFATSAGAHKESGANE
jgi:hypothetical protein